MTLKQKIASLIFRIKQSNIKTHIKYLLVIANIIICATSYVLTNNWLNNYLIIAETVGVAQVDASDTKTLPRGLYSSTMRDYVLSEVKKAGLNESEADCIIKNESNWREDICIIEPNNTISCGLWMLNTIHNKKGLTNSCKTNYKCATAFAIKLRKEQGNWSAWTQSKLCK